VLSDITITSWVGASASSSSSHIFFINYLFINYRYIYLS